MSKYRIEQVDHNLWAGYGDGIPECVTVNLRSNETKGEYYHINVDVNGVLEFGVMGVKVKLSELEQILREWKDKPDPTCGECGQELPKE